MTYITLGILSAITAALVAIFAKIGLKGVDNVLATTVRSFVMFAVLFLLALSLKKLTALHTLDSKQLWWIILSGIAGALSWLFYFWALSIAPATKVAALDRTSIVFVVIFSIFMLGEHFSWYSSIGSILIAVGAFLMVFAK